MVRLTAKERLIARIRRAEYQLRVKAQAHSAAVARAAELEPGMAPVPGEASSAVTLADLEAAAFKYAELVPGKKRRRRRKGR